MSKVAYIYRIEYKTVEKVTDSKKLKRFQAYSTGTIVYNLWFVDPE